VPNEIDYRKESTLHLQLYTASNILARWVVFKTFIQVAEELEELEGVVLQDDIQCDWLLFQIHPLVRINDMDPFSALVSLALG
jgi:hypothetical protein